MPNDLSPIRKAVTVPLTRAEAFRLFTERLEDWWPVESHSLSAADGKRPEAVTVEPGEGGRILETTHDGREAAWGTITDWVPGDRFAFDWHVGRDPADATQVTVRFLPSDQGTRVELDHGGWERLGETAMARRESYVTGWDLVLARFVEARALV